MQRLTAYHYLHEMVNDKGYRLELDERYISLYDFLDQLKGHGFKLKDLHIAYDREYEMFCIAGLEYRETEAQFEKRKQDRIKQIEKELKELKK